MAIVLLQPTRIDLTTNDFFITDTLDGPTTT